MNDAAAGPGWGKDNPRVTTVSLKDLKKMMKHESNLREQYEKQLRKLHGKTNRNS